MSEQYFMLLPIDLLGEIMQNADINDKLLSSCELSNVPQSYVDYITAGSQVYKSKQYSCEFNLSMYDGLHGDFYNSHFDHMSVTDDYNSNHINHFYNSTIDKLSLRYIDWIIDFKPLIVKSLWTNTFNDEYYLLIKNIKEVEINMKNRSIYHIENLKAFEHLNKLILYDVTFNVHDFQYLSNIDDITITYYKFIYIYLDFSGFKSTKISINNIYHAENFPTLQKLTLIDVRTDCYLKDVVINELYLESMCVTEFPIHKGNKLTLKSINFFLLTSEIINDNIDGWKNIDLINIDHKRIELHKTEKLNIFALRKSRNESYFNFGKSVSYVKLQNIIVCNIEQISTSFTFINCDIHSYSFLNDQYITKIDKDKSLIEFIRK